MQQTDKVMGEVASTVFPSHKPRDGLHGLKSGLFNIGSGTKQGYNFSATGGTQSLYTWDAQGQPSVAQTTGDRYFYTDHTGVIFYTTMAAFNATGTGLAQGGAAPVGQ